MNDILVSGSSSGIGKAVVDVLLQANKSVIGLARNHSKFQPDNANYHPLAIDFSDINKLEKQLRPLAQEYPDIDTLVCSAGYGQFAELEQWSVSQMQQLMNVNFLSQAILIKTFLPMMKRQGSGKIILIGSESALQGAKKGSLYCASKFALRGFSQSLRQECASSNISVTLINPGFVDTPFFDELDFAPEQGEAHSIAPQHIADMVASILLSPHHAVVEEINLQPLKKVLRKRAVNINKLNSSAKG